MKIKMLAYSKRVSKILVVQKIYLQLFNPRLRLNLNRAPSNKKKKKTQTPQKEKKNPA